MLDGGPPTDIWSSGFSFESPLKDLLDRGDYSVEELLAEDELLQELRGCHPQLVEFFSDQEAVIRLVQHVIRSVPEPQGDGAAATETDEAKPEKNEFDDVTGPGNDDDDGLKGNEEQNESDGDVAGDDEDDSDEMGVQESSEGENEKPDAPGEWLYPKVVEPPAPKASLATDEEMVQVRYPYMACEVICCEINSVIDILVDGRMPLHSKHEEEPEGGVEESKHDLDGKDGEGQTMILDLLFSVLYDTPSGELDDYRAGYFDKILSVLCRKRPQAMSTYINEGGGKGQSTLVNAMLKHLYSHSILQVVQRLLLPVPFPKSTASVTAAADATKLDDENQENAAWAAAAAIANGDDDDDDAANLFRCRWSESSESVHLLLDSLVGNGRLDQEQYGADHELRLYEAQNASEVLITVIQNSPLTSSTMKTLTTDPVLGRIVSGASTLAEDGEQAFSPHDSVLTCALNVFESLVLQLGGYGSVGTVVETTEGGEKEEENDSANEKNENGASKTDESRIASADVLLTHLPSTLDKLGKLLRDPSTQSWVSPMQFSKEEKQQILGTSRLKIVRLVESLVLLGNPEVDKVLCETKCLGICLELFWEFEWCSMLHQSVANLLVHVFEGANSRSTLQEFFLVRCDLLSRLVECFDEEAMLDTSDAVEPGNAMAPALIEEQEVEKNETAEEDSGHASFLSNDSEDSAHSGDSGDSTSALPEGSVPPAAIVSTPEDDEELPISDDDVEAAMEQEQAEQQSSVPNKSSALSIESGLSSGIALSGDGGVDAPTHLPSLRKGYMGHVIIICQALVHACSGPRDTTTDLGDSTDDLALSNTSSNKMMNGVGAHRSLVGGEEKNASTPETGDDQMLAKHSSEDDEESYLDSETAPLSNLIISHLIHAHPIRERWHEFVGTTLASETAIQSTPLGGFNASATISIDPLHTHRPPMTDLTGMFDGNDDDDDDDDDDHHHMRQGGLDIDDNDIEVAASMMEALSMSGSGVPNSSAGSDDDTTPPELKAQYEATAQQYMFDDPLGSQGMFGAGKDFGADGDGDSSDEEDDRGPSYMRGNSSGDEDPPVMDLFAGNNVMMNGETKVAGTEDSGSAAFADFASFDTPNLENAGLPSISAAADLFSASPPVEDLFAAPEAPAPVASDGSRVDDLFSSGPSHDFLLDDDDDEGRKGSTPFLLDDDEKVKEGEGVGDDAESSGTAIKDGDEQ